MQTEAFSAECAASVSCQQPVSSSTSPPRMTVATDAEPENDRSNVRNAASASTFRVTWTHICDCTQERSPSRASTVARGSARKHRWFRMWGIAIRSYHPRTRQKSSICIRLSAVFVTTDSWSWLISLYTRNNIRDLHRTSATFVRRNFRTRMIWKAICYYIKLPKLSPFQGILSRYFRFFVFFLGVFSNWNSKPKQVIRCK